MRLGENTEKKPEVLERAGLLKNSRWEQDIVDGFHKPKLKTTPMCKVNPKTKGWYLERTQPVSYSWFPSRDRKQSIRGV
jgi:hypothetical protein